MKQMFALRANVVLLHYFLLIFLNWICLSSGEVLLYDSYFNTCLVFVEKLLFGYFNICILVSGKDCSLVPVLIFSIGGSIALYFLYYYMIV